MSSASSRLWSIFNHLNPLGASSPPPHIHHLSPTFFLERAASIEPNAEAILHIASDGSVVRRSYRELADRASGLAYYLKSRGFRRVGILAPNTPAFLESIYGIVAAGAVIVPVNIRLKQEDIAYIFDFAEVDLIIADHEFVDQLGLYRESHAKVPILEDKVSQAHRYRRP